MFEESMVRIQVTIFPDEIYLATDGYDACKWAYATLEKVTKKDILIGSVGVKPATNGNDFYEVMAFVNMGMERRLKDDMENKTNLFKSRDGLEKVVINSKEQYDNSKGGLVIPFPIK